MGKKRIQLGKLMIGMIVAEDVYSMGDHLIVPKNTILNEKIIAKLNVYGVPTIYVLDVKNAENELEEQLIASENPTYLEKIRFSESFQVFDGNCKKMTGKLKNAAQIIIEEGIQPGMAEAMVSQMDTLFHGASNNMELLDMLHAMRNQSDVTFTHSINVAMISSVLGNWLKLPKEEMEVLMLAGLLHDIGKLLIPESILMKPFKLSDKEIETVRSHAMKGYNLVKEMDIDERVKYAILTHHERCDGSGYPVGASRDTISKEAKIIAIADVYDAMTSSRIYRESVCPFEVIAKFEYEGLQLYETEYIMTFLKNIANTYLHSHVSLSNDMVGEVIMINNHSLSKPVVKVEEKYIDLSKESGIKICAML